MAIAKQKRKSHTAASSSFTPADELSRARALIAKVDAAEKAGVPFTEENMQKLGYVKTEGGVWELPIPPHILRQI